MKREGEIGRGRETERERERERGRGREGERERRRWAVRRKEARVGWGSTWRGGR